MKRLYKDHLILGKEHKIMEHNKNINSAQTFYGIGRQKDIGTIQFTDQG